MKGWGGGGGKGLSLNYNEDYVKDSAPLEDVGFGDRLARPLVKVFRAFCELERCQALMYGEVSAIRLRDPKKQENIIPIVPL